MNVIVASPGDIFLRNYRTSVTAYVFSLNHQRLNAMKHVVVSVLDGAVYRCRCSRIRASAQLTPSAASSVRRRSVWSRLPWRRRAPHRARRPSRAGRRPSYRSTTAWTTRPLRPSPRAATTRTCFSLKVRLFNFLISPFYSARQMDMCASFMFGLLRWPIVGLLQHSLPFDLFARPHEGQIMAQRHNTTGFADVQKTRKGVPGYRRAGRKLAAKRCFQNCLITVWLSFLVNWNCDCQVTRLSVKTASLLLTRGQMWLSHLTPSCSYLNSAQHILRSSQFQCQELTPQSTPLITPQFSHPHQPISCKWRQLSVCVLEKRGKTRTLKNVLSLSIKFTVDTSQSWLWIIFL